LSLGGSRKMRSIHYFQRFSQRENMVTNNTLLLLHSVYQDNITRFQGFLNQLFEELGDHCPQVELSFLQQVKGEGSVPDAVISQTSFKIIIETKLYGQQYQDQLIQHLNSFGHEDIKILLLLDRQLPPDEFLAEVRKDILKFENDKGTKVFFRPVTFEEIIRTLRENLLNQDYELNEVVSEYEDFCREMDLLAMNEYILKALPCGFSLTQNKTYGIYYDPDNRSYGKHKYLGLYNQKAIRAIGEIKDIVTADYDFTSGKLTIKKQLLNLALTPEETQRIKDIIVETHNEVHIDISKGHKFYLVDKFYPTEFVKETLFALQGGKYFDLRDYVDKKELIQGKELPPVAQLAEILKLKTWK
jgi:hypothetical protein